MVCTAWRLALDPSAWPLRQCALTASAAPGHVDPVAEWLHRVRTGVRRLAVGSARPGEVAPFNSPSVQAAHRAFLSLRPRQVGGWGVFVGVHLVGVQWVESKQAAAWCSRA